jgi:hypothetical protein
MLSISLLLIFGVSALVTLLAYGVKDFGLTIWWSIVCPIIILILCVFVANAPGWLIGLMLFLPVLVATFFSCLVSYTLLLAIVPFLSQMRRGRLVQGEAEKVYKEEVLRRKANILKRSDYTRE